MVDLGWSQGPYALIARWIVPPGPFEAFIAVTDLGAREQVRLRRISGTTDIPTQFASFPASGSFPFGLEVEPDH